MPRARALAGLLLASLACAGTGGRDDAGPAALPPPPERGRLLLVLERGEHTRVVLLERGARPAVVAEDARDARFAGSGALVLLVETPPAEGFGLPDTQLERLDLARGTRRRIGPAGRHYDPQPSPDGRLLAVGSEAGALGDSDLEIWSLGASPRRLAVRHQSVEEPRWRHDGRALVASVLMADPDADETAAGFAGRAFHWPRLHRLRRDLGDPELVPDGDAPDSLVPGGSLPLWWDARGIFARQDRGLVRCRPEARRCALVYAPGSDRRVVAGQRVGDDEAWLLTVPAEGRADRRPPDAVDRISLPEGRLVTRWRAPEGVGILEIDWAPDP